MYAINLEIPIVSIVKIKGKTLHQYCMLFGTRVDCQCLIIIIYVNNKIL